MTRTAHENAPAPSFSPFALGFLSRDAFAVRTPPNLEARPSLELAGGSRARGQRTLDWDRPPNRALDAWSDFTRLHPGFRAGWDATTGAPVRLFGPGIVEPGSVASAAVAEKSTRRVLDAHIALFAPGASPSDFELLANDLTDGIPHRRLSTDARGLTGDRRQARLPV